MDALGGALRLDPTSPFAIAMLAFTCLLMSAQGGAEGAVVKAEEVLHEIAPELAELLFKTER